MADLKEETIEGIYDAMDSLHTAWVRYTTATDMIGQADWLITLSNRMSDLASWHPDYDIKTGLIGEWND